MDFSPKNTKDRILDIYQDSQYYRYRRKHGNVTMQKFIELYKKQILYFFLSIVGLIILFPIATYIIFAQDINDKDRLLNRNNTGITLLDRNGQPFFTFNQPKAFRYVTIDQISTPVQQAVVAAEDKDFYSNPGFSLRGILRAIYVDIGGGHLSQGGSTIDQELVKNALLNSNRTLFRKLEEATLAIEIDRRYSKKDILELYLNSVYFGEGAFGIQNAAQAYFGKDAKDLDIAQAAILAGLLPAPSAYDPLINDPNIALRKQHTVLDKMVESGYITKAQADDAKAEKIVYTPPSKTNDLNILAPHFALYVKDLIDKKYGNDNAVRRGLRVTTTINADWQAYAETVVDNQVKNLVYNNATNGSAVVLDPKNGEILAMVGSHDWNDATNGKTNMALQPRQPGSSFKPIIYGEAIQEEKITAATILHDDPTTFPGDYKPHDYDNKFRGPVTVRRALSNSLNVPAVEVMQEVGVENGLQFAKNLGITTLGTDASNYGLSLVLGAGEIPLLQMTNVFATYANQGSYNAPTAILQVKDKYGNVLENYEPKPQQVVSPQMTFIISSILSDNIARAEEFGNLLTISRTAAVKTGTTSDFKDALTIGYTPSLTVGVWVGNNNNEPMDSVAGSLGAAPIWRQLMEHFLAGTPVEKFQKPDGVVSAFACPYRGSANSKLATGSGQIEFFIQGTEPTNGSCMPQTPSPKLSPTNKPSATPTEKPSETPSPSDTPRPIPTEAPTPTKVIHVPTDTSIPSPTLNTSTPPVSPTL